MVNQLERRLAEAAKLGFTRAVYPRSATANGRPLAMPPGLQGYGAATLQDALEYALVPKEGEGNEKPGRRNRRGNNQPTETPVTTPNNQNGPVVDEFGEELEGYNLDDF